MLHTTEWVLSPNYCINFCEDRFKQSKSAGAIVAFLPWAQAGAVIMSFVGSWVTSGVVNLQGKPFGVMKPYLFQTYITHR
jgi:hypothetical protein